MFPLVRELAVEGIPVTVTCRVLNLCRAQYYRWVKRNRGMPSLICFVS